MSDLRATSFADAAPCRAPATVLWRGIDLQWAYGELLGSIRRRTRSADHAYDVLHDALVRLAARGGGEPLDQPHAYLRAVVGSVLADHGRDRARWLPYPDADPDHGRAEHPDLAAARRALAPGADERVASPEHMAEVRRRLMALQRIVDCLPPRRREVFWLHRVEGYTQPEIAAKLRISLKIVERHVMRAMMDIRGARLPQS